MSTTTVPVIHHFGEYRLDSANRRLRHRDKAVTLPRKAFQCVACLVEHRDRAVSRDELIEAVWGTVHQTDNALAQAVFQARHALGDTGEAQQYIETVRGFGYRWVAPVEEVDTPKSAAGALRGLRRMWSGLLAAALLAVALAGGAIYLWRGDETEDLTDATWRTGEGDIALLLPVAVDPKDGQSWIRFGVMDLIAERLRAAGQPMVPSETVIALTRGRSDRPDQEGLDRLTSTTGARLVLAARAQTVGARWRVMLRSLAGGQPPRTTVAEADDVLDASRVAADRMALALGLTPAPELDAEPGVATLLRRAEAATLAQQTDLARELIEAAAPEVRARPDVRLQLARIEFYSHHLDAAQKTYESLLQEPAVRRDPAIRARALHGLGTVHYQRGAYGATEARLAEAARLLDDDDSLGILGTIQRSLGLVLLVQGRLDEARTHLARAQRALESTGDAFGLAILENNLAVFETLRERYPEALDHFRRSAEAHALLYNVRGELRNRANMVEILLALLDPHSASVLAPRLEELLSQTANPDLVAFGEMALAAILNAEGQSRAADKAIAEIARLSENRGAQPTVRPWLHMMHAERLTREGDLGDAAAVAADVIDHVLSRDDSLLLHDYLGRSGMIVLRAHLHDHAFEAAADIVAEMSDWTGWSPTRGAKIYAALARAELAAGQGRRRAAGVAFEEARTLADATRVPVHMRYVAESYVRWLLAATPRGGADPERALLVAHSLVRFADRDYRTALLQLRTYHALGPPSAWRAALARTRSLAGERGIPTELQAPPPSRASRDARLAADGGSKDK